MSDRRRSRAVLFVVIATSVVLGLLLYGALVEFLIRNAIEKMLETR